LRPVFFLLLVLLSVICLSRWGVRHENPIASHLTALLTPIQAHFRHWIYRSEDRFQSWQEVIRDHRRVEEIERENRRLKSALALFEAVRSENSRLRRLHHLTDRSPWQTLPGVVIGRGGEQFQTLILDQGAAHGVAVDHPVIAYAGLVGRILAVQPHASLVLQITDPNSSVGVYAGPTPDEKAPEAIPGILSGQGGRRMIMEPRGGVDVPAGWPVYTSSISTIYPSGFESGRWRDLWKPAIHFRGALWSSLRWNSIPFGRCSF
jgi:rod shape-determining protein MreC